MTAWTRNARTRASQGRKPAEPGAQSASLDGRQWSGIELAKRDAVHRSDQIARSASRSGSVPTTHCADLLTAPGKSPPVAMCAHTRKSAIRPLYYLTTDRGAPCAFFSAYQAVLEVWRLASPAKFFDKPPSDKKLGRASSDRENFRVDLGAVDMPISLSTAGCSSYLSASRGEAPEPRRLRRSRARFACRSGARQTDPNWT